MPVGSNSYRMERLMGQFVIQDYPRWVNYYIEGLKWNIFDTEGAQIDGVYYDGIAFERIALNQIEKND